MLGNFIDFLPYLFMNILRKNVSGFLSIYPGTLIRGLTMAAGNEVTFLREIQGDLFSCPSSASLVHCISEDVHMGKGIATLFKKKFGRVEEIRSQKTKPGGVAILKCDDRFVYYLVTKRRYFHKPTYESVLSSLAAMKSHAVANGVDEICMPKIGCGLDKLEWSKVKHLLENEFKDTRIGLTVYYL
eukprot:m.17378 g.17378  ORF g.17378 m.17378 type:complete len:186 (+) comp27476_c0_seq1:691-1248(+)